MSADESQQTDELKVDRAQQLESEKLRQENEKLKYEIEELKAWRKKLYFGIFSAVLSAFVAVVTFLYGQNASKSLDRIHAKDSLYQEAITDLGDKDPAQRLSGITALKHFLTPSPSEGFVFRFFTFSSNGEVEDLARKARRHDAVVLLIARLRNETDIGVIRQSLAAIKLAPPLPLEDLADLNRDAALSFAQSSAKFSGQLLLAGSRKTHIYYQEDVCKTEDVLSIESYMQNLVLRSLAPPDENKMYSTFEIWPFLYSPMVVSLFESQQRQTLHERVTGSIAKLFRIPTLAEIDESRIDFLQKSLYLEATSLALAAALKTRQDTSPVDLSWVALVTGELKLKGPTDTNNPQPKATEVLNLAGINLRGSYLGIPVSAVSFANANLSQADIRELTIREGTTFAGADLNGTMVAKENAADFVSAHGELLGKGFKHAQIKSRVDYSKPMPLYCTAPEKAAKVAIVANKKISSGFAH
jgi:hypothetical protein